MRHFDVIVVVVVDVGSLLLLVGCWLVLLSLLGWRRGAQWRRRASDNDDDDGDGDTRWWLVSLWWDIQREPIPNPDIGALLTNTAHGTLLWMWMWEYRRFHTGALPARVYSSRLAAADDVCWFSFLHWTKKKLAFYFSGPKNSVAEHFWFALLPREWHMEGRGNHDDDGAGCFFLIQNTEHSRRFLRYFFQQDPLHTKKTSGFGIQITQSAHFTLQREHFPRGTHWPLLHGISSTLDQLLVPQIENIFQIATLILLRLL